MHEANQSQIIEEKYTKFEYNAEQNLKTEINFLKLIWFIDGKPISC